MILSVSRRTDIPNYYSEWFLNRLEEGFLYVRNPMNPHQVSRIELSPSVVDCIVFWTKNPANMIPQLDRLQGYPYYFQFTLTGYGKDIEPNLPDKKEVLLPVFRDLSSRIGKERVVWRYDPILLSERYTAKYHLEAFEEIAANLSGCTKRVVISFVDLYAKTQRNMAGFHIRELIKEEMRCLAGEMAGIAARHQMTIETCAEQIDLEDLGVRHGSCIDKELIEQIVGYRLSGKKDKNQRAGCGCMESVEVGTYHTCRNGCKYCYANFSEEKVRESVKLYDASSPLLCGTIGAEDRITNRKMSSKRYLDIERRNSSSVLTK